MIKYICIVIGCLTCISCASTTSLYSWRGYDEAIYAYTEKADETRMRQILKVYEKILKSKGTRGVPAPGICADYGFLLIKNGEVDKGKQLLQKEIEFYPESETSISRILKRFEE